MSKKVSNGGIGKGPAIDKLNQIKGESTKSSAVKSMEGMVCQKKSMIKSDIPISFEKCKKELKEQIKIRKGKTIHGGRTL